MFEIKVNSNVLVLVIVFCLCIKSIKRLFITSDHYRAVIIVRFESIQVAIYNKTIHRFFIGIKIGTKAYCIQVQWYFGKIIFKILPGKLAIGIKITIKKQVVQAHTVTKIVAAKKVYFFIPIIKIDACIGFGINSLSIP